MKAKEIMMTLKDALVQNEEIHSDIRKAKGTFKRSQNSKDLSVTEVNTAIEDYDFVADKNSSAQALLLLPVWLRLAIIATIGVASSILSFVLLYQVCSLAENALVSAIESWPSPVWTIAFVVIWLAVAFGIVAGLYYLSTWLCRVVARSRIQHLESYRTQLVNS